MTFKLAFAPMENGTTQLQFPVGMLDNDITHAAVKFKKNDNSACVQIALLTADSEMLAVIGNAEKIVIDKLNGTAPYINILAKNVGMWVSSRIRVDGQVSEGEGDSFLSFYGKLSPVYAACVNDNHLEQVDESTDEPVLDDGAEPSFEPSEEDACDSTASEEADASIQEMDEEKEIESNDSQSDVVNEADLGDDPLAAAGAPEELEDVVDVDSRAEDVNDAKATPPPTLVLHNMKQVKRGDGMELAIKIGLSNFPSEHEHYSLSIHDGLIKVLSGSRKYIKDAEKRLYKYHASGNTAFNATSDLSGEKLLKYYGIQYWVDVENPEMELVLGEENTHVEVEDGGNAYVFNVDGMKPVDDLIKKYGAPTADKSGADKNVSAEPTANLADNVATMLPPTIESIEKVQSQDESLELQGIIETLKGGGYYITTDDRVLVAIGG